MTSEKIWVGIDVCQGMLDVYLLPEEESLQLPNTEVGVRELVEKLQPLAPSLVVAESTGGLERLLVSGLQEASLPVAIANPRKVKGFAIALGKAKTDKLDAQVIARFAQSVQPEPLPIVKPEAQKLAALRRRRQQLVAMQVAEKNRLSRATKIVQADIEEHLEQIEQRLKSLNQQIQTVTSATIGLETQRQHLAISHWDWQSYISLMFGRITRIGNPV